MLVLFAKQVHGLGGYIGEVFSLMDYLRKSGLTGYITRFNPERSNLGIKTSNFNNLPNCTVKEEPNQCEVEDKTDDDKQQNTSLG